MLQFNFTTALGKVIGRNLFSFLSDEEFEELNSIGYSGKTTKGIKMSREDYLNSLGKGQFLILQIKHDKGDFVEEFVLTKG